MAEILPPILEAAETSVISEGWFLTLATRKREIQRLYGGHSSFISVFGSSLTSIGSKDWIKAYKVGEALARGGAVTLNGGYGGSMEACSAGAKSCGGLTVGVTCNNLPEESPNRYVSHEWLCERWDQRMLALVWLADGYIVLPGSSGTLVELAMVIETQLKGFIPIRPVVCLGTFWKPVVQRIISTASIVRFASTPVVAAQFALGLTPQRRMRATKGRIQKD